MAIEGAKCEIWLGLPGSGKSLDQTMTGVLQHLLDGEEVWCCYWLNWNLPNYHYFAPKDFDTIKDLRNAVIVFDELAQTFEPREWEMENSEVRSFFQLHRHRHLDILASTIDFSLCAKSLRIIASNFYYCTKIEYHPIILWLMKLLGINKGVDYWKDELTPQELQKMALGWELGENIATETKPERVHWNKKNLIRVDLDDYKIELVHKYCPKCASRQGTQILKEETDKICNWDKKTGYTLKKPEKCPKHKDIHLEIKESGMYDTDYEPEIKEKQVKFKAFMSCKLIDPDGKMIRKQNIEYKGRLSDRQKNIISNMESNS